MTDILPLPLLFLKMPELLSKCCPLADPACMTRGQIMDRLGGIKKCLAGVKVEDKPAFLLEEINY